MNLFRRVSALLLLLLCTCTLASAESAAASETDMPEASPTDIYWGIAEDLTMACTYNEHYTAVQMAKITDGKYKTYLDTVQRGDAHAIRVFTPEDKPAYGVVLKWRSHVIPHVAVQVQNESGEWVTVAENEAKYWEEYIYIPGATAFRIVGAENKKTKLQVCELRVLGKGAIPDWVHIWQDAPEQVDLMLIHGHPDDEILWFGGLLPTYAGEQGRKTLVVCAAYNAYYRKLELLDCLWTCGVRIYPYFLGYEDFVNAGVDYTIKRWGKNVCYKDFTLLLRRYRPKVLVLQDEDGEYGHGIHKATSKLGRLAVGMAADPQWYEDAGFETWQVQKVYVHLWKENQIDLDWNTPLTAFDGKTALEVAREAYRCHTSQQHKKYYSVDDHGEYNNSSLGLWYTAVGPDEAGNDLFEHLED